MQSEKELLRTIAEVAGVGGWDLDPERREVRWTDHTRAIHEVDDDFEITLENALDFYPEGSRQTITAAVEKALGMAEAYDLELEIVTAKARRIWVRAVGRAIVEGGRVVRVVGTFQDITDIRRERRTLSEALANAEAASVAKGQFLAVMSHEIRTPMNGMIGMLDVIRANDLSQEQRRRVDVARRSAGDLLALLNDILDYAKLEADRVTIEGIPLDIDQLVDDVTVLFGALADQKKLTLSRAFGPNIPAHVVGDPLRIKQILSNLVGNAIKFTEAGSVGLNVTYDPQAERLTIEVADTGIGIGAEQLTTLFDPFAQADASITRRFGGTGLGLSISKGLAQRMGGDITATSTEGVGTTFTFDIPLPTCDTAPPAREDSVYLVPDRRKPNGSPLRLLVADDHPVNREVIRALLSADGHDIVLVENGQEAVDAFDRGPFDVVLLDIEMPVMDGFEAARTIRERYDPDTETPIIALTARDPGDDLSPYRAAGMDGRLAKPIEIHALKRLLAQYGERST